MGANQSDFEDPEDLLEYNLYRSSTLQHNRQSISLIGERLANQNRFDQIDSCNSFNMKMHKYSTTLPSEVKSQKPRSLSLDGAQTFSVRTPFVEKSHNVRRKKTNYLDKSNTAIPIETLCKVRKRGFSHHDSHKKMNLKLDVKNKILNTMMDVVKLNNYGDQIKPNTITNVSKDKYDSEQSLHSMENFEDNMEENCSYMYDNSLSRQQLPSSEFKNTERDEYNLVNGEAKHPRICLITSLNEIYNLDDEDTLKCSNDALQNNQRYKINEHGRQSEPSYPSQLAPALLLRLPGLGIRRHTLPNSRDCAPYQEMTNTNPIFTTTSWETLPPEEEMEVMEDKPIEINEDKTEKDDHFTSKSLISKDLLHSNSSFPRSSKQNKYFESISAKDGFSFNDIKTNCSDDFEHKNKSPKIVHDASSDYAISEFKNDQYSFDEHKAAIQQETFPKVIYPSPTLTHTRKFYKTHDDDQRLKNSSMHTLSIFNDTNDTEMLEKQISGDFETLQTDNLGNITEVGVHLHINENIQPYCKPQIIEKSFIPKESESNNLLVKAKNNITSDLEYNYEYSTNIPINFWTENFDHFEMYKYYDGGENSEDDSENSIIFAVDNYALERKKNYSQAKNTNIEIYETDSCFQLEEDRHRNKRIKGSLPDHQNFIHEVETRIPNSPEAIVLNSVNKESRLLTSSKHSFLPRDQILFTAPAAIYDVSSQILLTPSLIRCSSTPSLCISDSCNSSLLFSDSDEEFYVNEDNINEDEYEATEKSFSSTPPDTPLLSSEDTCSLSLSLSVDNFDLQLESGNRVSSYSHPSRLPIQLPLFDLAYSNLSLSSEDIGLNSRKSKLLKHYLSSKTKRVNNQYCHRSQNDLASVKHNIDRHCENQENQTNPISIKFGKDFRKPNGKNEKQLNYHKGKYSINYSLSEPQLQISENENDAPTMEKHVPFVPNLHQNPITSKNLATLLISKDISSPIITKYFIPSNRNGLNPKRSKSDPELYFNLLNLHQNSSSSASSNSEFHFNTIIRKRSTKSPKECSEIEALEACKWLRAAGFPQYSQMYEDFLFPLDLCSVERDHAFLDADSIQALFRRLRVLNRCAKIRHESRKKNQTDDSDDEEPDCALSGNWTFEKHSRRWSRIEANQFPFSSKKDLQACGSNRMGDETEDYSSDQFKRSGSEKLKDGAKAFLRRMESLKNKKKRRHRDGIVISSPKVLDEALMQVKMAELGCISIPKEGTSEVGRMNRPNIYHRSASDQSSTRMTSYLISDRKQTISGEDSSSLTSDQSQPSVARFRSSRRKRFWRRGFSGDAVGAMTENSDDMSTVGRLSCAYSDSECSPPLWHHRLSDTNCYTKTESLLQSSKPVEKKRSNLRHASSLTYGKESQKIREDFISSLKTESRRTSEDNVENSNFPSNRSAKEARHSIYDNVPIVIYNENYFEYHNEDANIDLGRHEESGSSECTMESRDSPLPSNQDEESEEKCVRRGTVERWHSFNRKSASVDIFQRTGTQICGFSVGQMNHLRKRALLKLTALMERYCPTNRSSWNWELPKFIRKIKAPDYKDRSVFGIPLQIINQRTGCPLPLSIQQALFYLKNNCMDQIGIFRKPGVRSRIQRLRELHETEDEIQYYNFGPYDIADMVKLYFRELPEVLLTNKLSEIFIAICQYLPVGVRLEALQCVMLMMPDENREVLMHLLSFLADVAANSHLNQMTESNLSVCLAPSLFHLTMGGTSSSPLRKKASGSPEQKDLHDNKSAHQCLTLMIQEVNNLQCVPMEMLSNCRFSFLDLSQPVALEDLGSTTNISFAFNQGESHWIAYMNACIDSLLKESRDRVRGWFHINHPNPHVEVCYRKVGDGHPLRLWKATTEVEAPPIELLNRVLRERHLWDETLLKWRVVSRLHKQAEVFQYMCSSMHPRPPVDYCVLRCWKTDMGKGLCVIVETSVEHPNAPPLLDSTRGIVLASRYMIQPCGSGRSRITNISRIDTRGRLPEWYNKSYAFFAANYIVKLRQSFQHFATGPESKV